MRNNFFFFDKVSRRLQLGCSCFPQLIATPTGGDFFHLRETSSFLRKWQNFRSSKPRPFATSRFKSPPSVQRRSAQIRKRYHPWLASEPVTWSVGKSARIEKRMVLLIIGSVSFRAHTWPSPFFSSIKSMTDARNCLKRWRNSSLAPCAAQFRFQFPFRWFMWRTVVLSVRGRGHEEWNDLCIKHEE